MPAHLYEFICAYIWFKNKHGRPPTSDGLAALLDIDRCTALQRKNKLIKLGLIADPGYLPRGKDWLKLTDKGAEVFSAILDGVEPVMITNGVYCCLNRDLFPPMVDYEYLPIPKYRQYMKALSSHGHADPS